MSEIEKIIILLEDSKKIWKTQIVVFWDYAGKVLKDLEDQTPIDINLPAFDNPKITLTAKELRNICISQEEYLAYSHLTYIFTLFGILTTDVNKQNLKIDSFLKNNGVIDQDIREITLARETRNGYVHYMSKAHNDWIEAYNKAKPKKSPIKEGDPIKNAFVGNAQNKLLQQIYDWHELLIKTSRTIVQKNSINRFGGLIK